MVTVRYWRDVLAETGGPAPQGSHMCDPQTTNARVTGGGLAMASPYG